MSHLPFVQLIVMGVSGSGKSTMAGALGEAFNLCVTDGDDLHLPASVQKMQSGIPLTDDDRWPWLDRVAARLQSALEPNSPQAGRVIACSALRLAYRDHLRRQVPNLRFVFLHGDAKLLQQRMADRTGHFMHSHMLDSQLATLEIPGKDEPDVFTLQAGQDIPSKVALIAAAFKLESRAASSVV